MALGIILLFAFSDVFRGQLEHPRMLQMGGVYGGMRASVFHKNVAL